MKYRRSLAVWVIVALGTLIMTALAMAQSGVSSVLWDSYAAYGVSAGGPYVVADAVGESVAGSSSGGGYNLTDGGPPGLIEDPPTPLPGATPTSTPSPTPLTSSPTPTPTQTPPPDDWKLIYLPSVIGD